MSIREDVLDYLKKEPRFRERSNKDRGIVNLLMQKYASVRVATESGVITKEMLTTLVQEYATADRSWRQALEENPPLRGKDYSDKTRLVQQKRLELGYTPGYSEDRRKLKTL